MGGNPESQEQCGLPLHLPAASSRSSEKEIETGAGGGAVQAVTRSSPPRPERQRQGLYFLSLRTKKAMPVTGCNREAASPRSLSAGYVSKLTSARNSQPTLPIASLPSGPSIGLGTRIGHSKF